VLLCAASILLFVGIEILTIDPIGRMKPPTLAARMDFSNDEIAGMLSPLPSCKGKKKCGISKRSRRWRLSLFLLS
jgi:hypothetical protein